MELKTKNNIWLFLYRMWTGKAESLPNTICPLFWGGILGFFTIILSPLLMLVTLFIWIFSKRRSFLEIKRNVYNANGLGFIIYNFIAVILFFAFSVFGFDMMGFNDSGVGFSDAPWYFWTFAWTLMPLTAITVLFVIWSVVMLYENRPRKTYKEKKQPSVASQGLKDFYNKYCTRIEWKR